MNTTLLRAENHTLASELFKFVQNQLTFVVIADPQPGLLERYIEKRPEPYRWDREINLVERAVKIINSLRPKPCFIVVCGDLVDAQPGKRERIYQIKDLMSVFSNIDSEIPLITLPGNHDVGDHPNPDDVTNYTNTWGDDYYSFVINRIRFIVLNSQYLWDDSNCKTPADEFQAWLDCQLSKPSEDFNFSVVFQHIPFFVDHVNEPDDYFNLPQKIRHSLLEKFSRAGVRYIFTGHLHRNQTRSWKSSEEENSSLNLITTSSVCVQLGQDQPGLNLCQIDLDLNLLKSKYWSLDKLEYILDGGSQPQFDHS